MQEASVASTSRGAAHALQHAPSDDGWGSQEYIMVAPAHTGVGGGTPRGRGSVAPIIANDIDGPPDEEMEFRFEESGSDCGSESGEDPDADGVAGIPSKRRRLRSDEGAAGSVRCLSTFNLHLHMHDQEVSVPPSGH